jgi:hypothetical protein
MKVRVADDNLVQDEWQPLSSTKDYFVVAIATDLKSGRTAAFLMDIEREGAHPAAYDISSLSIVDASLPSEWRTKLFAEGISTPYLVTGPEFLLDKQNFINLHDVNLDAGEEEKIKQYLVELSR